MFTKGQIISIMNSAVQLIDDLSGGIGNEIADDLQDCVTQLECEWLEDLKKEDEED